MGLILPRICHVVGYKFTPTVPFCINPVSYADLCMDSLWEPLTLILQATGWDLNATIKLWIVEVQ